MLDGCGAGGGGGAETSAWKVRAMALPSRSRVSNLGQLLLNSFKMIYSLKGKEADVHREKNYFEEGVGTSV